MFFQPFQITAAIDDFVYARLKEKNRQKCRNEDLQNIC